MLVLAAVCFAIAQPKLFLPRAVANWFGLNSPRPAAAVFVFDVSYRMEYRVAGVSRLDDARQRALDLLHDLPPQSQVAVLDTGADGGDDEADDEWIPSAAAGGAAHQQSASPTGAPPWFVRSRRPRRCWRKWGRPENRRRGCCTSSPIGPPLDGTVKGRSGVKIPAGVQVAYIDFGVDQPRDLDIEKIEINPLVVAPGGAVTVTADLRAVGTDFDGNLLCQIDNEANPASRHVKMTAGKDREVFILKAPTPVRPAGTSDAIVTEPHQIVVKLRTLDDRIFKDDMAHDNTRFATFQVREDLKRQGRQVLTLADDPKAVRIWKAAPTPMGSAIRPTAFIAMCDRPVMRRSFGLKELATVPRRMPV